MINTKCDKCEAQLLEPAHYCLNCWTEMCYRKLEEELNKNE